MVWNRLVQGVIAGLVEIVLLLCLMPTDLGNPPIRSASGSSTIRCCLFFD